MRDCKKSLIFLTKIIIKYLFILKNHSIFATVNKSMVQNRLFVWKKI